MGTPVWLGGWLMLGPCMRGGAGRVEGGGAAELGCVGARVREGALGPWGCTPSHTGTPVGEPAAQRAGLIQCLHTSGAHEAPGLGESVELVCTPSSELPPSCGPQGGPGHLPNLQ